MICAGIDAGSRAIKIVLVEAATGAAVASGVTDQGVDQAALAGRLLDGLLAGRGLGRGDLGGIVATGYGRHTLEFADKAVTEITCHAVGVRRLLPEARTIIEIGGQDSKVIHLANGGGVQDFSMNDRCAAGSGRFLELVAGRLGAGLGEAGELAGRSQTPAVISSMCVVFAETEIIGLMAGGTAPEDILAGVLESIATRVCSLAIRRLDSPVAFTGGVALVPGMAGALARRLGTAVVIPDAPQLTGALGAALLAARGD